MNTIKKISSILILASIIGSYNLYAQNLNLHQKGRVQSEQEKKYRRIYTNSNENLTKDEINLQRKIGDLVTDKIAFVNNKMTIVNLSKQDFIKNNIPEFYYTDLLSNIEEINNSIVKGEITPEEAKKGLEKSKAAYKTRRANEKK